MVRAGQRVDPIQPLNCHVAGRNNRIDIADVVGRRPIGSAKARDIMGSERSTGLLQ